MSSVLVEAEIESQNWRSVCVCVRFVCMGLMCVHVCMWRPEYNLGCYSSKVYLVVVVVACFCFGDRIPCMPGTH